MSRGSLETGNAWYSGSRLAPMTWELLGCKRKARQQGHRKLPLGNIHFPTEAAGELGAKEPPQAVKLHLTNQRIRMSWDLVECGPGEPGDRQGPHRYSVSRLAPMTWELLRRRKA